MHSACVKSCVYSTKMSLSKFEKVDLNEKKVTKGKKRHYDSSVTDDFVTKKHFELQNKDTKRAERAAEKAFNDYLVSIEAEDFEFWNFEVDFLDNLLCKFWFAVRQTEIDEETKKPKHYKVGSLKSLCYALNRVLKERGKKYDIIFDPLFNGSQTAFADACKDLKAKGLGFVKPTDEILPNGMNIS